MQKLLFPMPYMNITQGYGYGSHKGTFAIDVAGSDSGVDYLVAPFTGVIKKKWANGNSVWLESTEPVLFADGTVDYATCCFTHDNNISDLTIGQVIQQGARFYEEGTAGNASGNHVHLEVAKGRYTGTGWYLNGDGVWTLNNSVAPQNSFWLKDITVLNNGGYAWKKDEEPILQGFQRNSLAGTRYRDAPNTSAGIRETFQEGYTYDFKGWVTGEVVGGNNIWFVGKYSGGYAWSGGFTDSGTHDLEALDAVPTPPVVTPPVVEPPVVELPDYTFTKDLDVVTSVLPARNGNFAYNEFPVSPEKIVLHDFGTKGVDTFGSTKNEFTKKGTQKSAHFVVSGKEIVQMVSLKDRAYHAGPNGNNFIGIESDPAQDADTIASVKKLIAALEKFYNKSLPIVKHSSLMATACGDDINLDNYIVVPPVVEPPVEPPVVEPPVVEPPIVVPPTTPLEAFIKAIAAFLAWLFGKRN